MCGAHQLWFERRTNEKIELFVFMYFCCLEDYLYSLITLLQLYSN